jgi:hypothetical protein
MDIPNFYSSVRLIFVSVISIVSTVMSILHVQVVQLEEFSQSDFEEVENSVDSIDYSDTDSIDDSLEALTFIDKAHKVLGMSQYVDADNIKKFQQIVDRTKYHLKMAAPIDIKSYPEWSISEGLAYDEIHNLEEYIYMNSSTGFTMVFRMD